MDLNQLAFLLKHESHYTKAMVLCLLEPGMGAGLLMKFPKKDRHLIIEEIAGLGTMYSPEEIDDLPPPIKDQLGIGDEDHKPEIAGLYTAPHILASLPEEDEDDIMRELNKVNPEAARTISSLRFRFQDILGLDDSFIKNILEHIDEESLKLALVSANQELQDKFFSNMAPEKAGILKNLIKNLSPAETPSVNTARQKIIQTIARLEQEGEISISKTLSGDNDFQKVLEVYENGDYESALEMFLPLAEKGNVEAQSYLGAMYASGEGTTENFDEALKWFKRAADQNDFYAQYSLGRMYQYGIGVDLDEEAAEKWYQLSAKQGFAPAQYMLGLFTIMKDPEEALNLYRSAAEQGYPEAQFDLGEFYEQGIGVTRNRDEAIKWYQLAADQDDPSAQYKMGSLYFEGVGMTQNLDKAISWFQKAAQNGHSGAQNKLGILYLEGRGVAKGYKEAGKWFRLAAENGDSESAWSLGRLYEQGQGFPRDLKEAFKWYKVSADLGNEYAQYKLGEMYLQGTGVPQNNITALMWFILSELNTNTESLQYIETLAHQLSLPEIEKAVLLAQKEFMAQDIRIMEDSGMEDQQLTDDTYEETFTNYFDQLQRIKAGEPISDTDIGGRERPSDSFSEELSMEDMERLLSERGLDDFLKIQQEDDPDNGCRN